MVYIVPNENEFKSDPTAKLTGEGNVIVFDELVTHLEISPNIWYKWKVDCVEDGIAGGAQNIRETAV